MLYVEYNLLCFISPRSSDVFGPEHVDWISLNMLFC